MQDELKRPLAAESKSDSGMQFLASVNPIVVKLSVQKVFVDRTCMYMYGKVAMLRIDKDLQTPIHQQLEDALLDEIVSGRLKPGDKVFSENSIAKEYGMSRTTVRSVYDRLVTRGIFSRSAGKGTYVAIPAMSANLNLLVGFSEKMNAKGVKPTTRVLGRQVIEADAEAAAALQIQEHDQVVQIRRIRLLDSRPFVIHTAVLPFPRFVSVLDYDLEEGSLTSYLQTATKFSLARAQEAITAVPAADEASELLDIRKGSPVLVVRGITFDTDDLPVRYSTARYNSSLVQLETGQQRERIVR